MHKLKAHLLKTFFSLFLSIFLPLLAIASIIILVQMSEVTAVVQLNAFEMFQLYLFIVPQILFYTIPLAYFIAGVMTINRLSNDNEMVVLFALGIKPGKILALIFKVSLFFSAILLATSLVVVPHAYQLYKNFVNYKKSNATFNIQASEFGQKFGDWMLYIGKEKEGKIYEDIALFKPDSQKREFIVIAKEAQITNENLYLQFKLNDGKAFIYENDTLSQINFQTMQINDTSAQKALSYQHFIDYWKEAPTSNRIREEFVLAWALSFLPLIGLTLFMTIGVVNNRHQKSYTSLFTFIAVALFFSMMIVLNNVIGLYSIPTLLILWPIGSYYIYYKRVLKRY